MQIIFLRPDITDSWMLHNRIFDLKRHFCDSTAFYLLDRSSFNFFIFLELKNVVKGRDFGNIQKSTRDMLNSIAVEDVKRCCQQWE